MKTIGLLGGMSWESTQTYYRLINEGVKARLGGLHSAQLAIYSIDFGPIGELQHAEEWDAAGRVITEAAQRVEAAGADFLLLCSNTAHWAAPEVERAIDIPLLHIADATADTVEAAGVEVVGLLGTRFTMEQDFYRERLSARHGLEVLTPDEGERELVHRVIYDELCLGELLDHSRNRFVAVIEKLAERGAAAVILGCTEISLLVKPEHSTVPLFDTTAIHAEAAVREALQDS